MNDREFVMQPIHLPPYETVPFRLLSRWLVPNTPGVYMFHDLRGVLYIGRSSNLRRRFTEHYEECGNPLLTLVMQCSTGLLNFSWIETDELMQAPLESRLIDSFLPPCNRQRGAQH